MYITTHPRRNKGKTITFRQRSLSRHGLVLKNRAHHERNLPAMFDKPPDPPATSLRLNGAEAGSATACP